MINEPATQPSPEEARSAAAAIVAPDPVTANLLAKHAAGEKLSQSEYGKLGAIAKAKKFFGIGSTPGQPAPARTGDAPAVGAVAPAQAPSGGLPVVPIDAGLAQRTTRVLLAKAEAIAQRKLSAAAKLLDPNPKAEALARVTNAANFSPDDKALMVDLSPDVCRELQIDVRKYCLGIFFGTFGMWATNLWLTVDEFKQEARAKEKAAAPSPAPPPPAHPFQQPAPVATTPAKVT